jgi:hypothetical protein
MWKAVFLVLALAGCTVPTDAEDAAAACSGIVNPNIRDECMARYVSNVQAERNAEWDMVGASMLNRPVQTSCTNIGGIVTCSSR